MVRAWYHDGAENEPRCLPHMLHSGEYLTLGQLEKLTGIEYFQFDADTVDSNEDYQKLREKRGYKNEDCVELSREKFSNFDDKMEVFYKEHLHADEEIRFVADGSGYFDLRAVDSDQWIRIEVVKNDMLIVPGGTYHRFTLDSNEYIKARRLFTEAPSWTPINRPHGDSHPVRLQYLQGMGVEAH
ncbi:1,2-dihydroxy-3-keto-5-methylthiopentene dioxygenase [Elysia marginata]|uniref:Acireductone dioxygenase n=1 Tax=Elysia marginata TaxID=1093978 RepID=A0AAV4IDV7_9GAST|nr:1,2-dihydroxy-3-keto-5-methylthiopentene dioxygenase [Elysia marginata]